MIEREVLSEHTLLMLRLLLIGLTLFSMAAQAQPEEFYVEQTCSGEIEVRLPDRTRVDCLTNEYAIEYDFSNKWAEAIGQALHVARQPMLDRSA